MKQTILINSLSDLPLAAKELLSNSGNTKIFAFKGEMGAGKTTFIKTLCEELGVTDTVSSPTFSIVNQYQSSRGETIFHFDFYRIKSITEAYDLGYEEYLFSGSYCFIEWAEKIEELLPTEIMNVEIIKEGEKRKIVFSETI